MKPVLLTLLFAGLLGCDDEGGTSPEPEPEPEPAPTVPMLVETHTLGPDGALLFRDEYAHEDGQLSGIFRSGPDGRTAAVWLPERDEAGRLTRIAVGLGQEDFFAYEEVNFEADQLQGFFHADASGATVAALLFEYSPAGTLRSMQVVDGPRTVYTDHFAYRDGVPSQVVRMGPGDDLLAAMALTTGSEAEITRIDVSTPGSQSYTVEYTYDSAVRAEPGPLGLIVLYPLTLTDGAPLPPLPASP